MPISKSFATSPRGGRGLKLSHSTLLLLLALVALCSSVITLAVVQGEIPKAQLPDMRSLQRSGGPRPTESPIAEPPSKRFKARARPDAHARPSPSAFPEPMAAAETEADREFPTVLVLTPLKNSWKHLERYWQNLLALDYPKSRISVGFLESDSDDIGAPDGVTTMGELQRLREQHGARYRRVQIVQHGFGLQLSREQRHDMSTQLLRRSVMARSRNLLLSRTLGSEEYVLWVDSDLDSYPPHTLRSLLQSGKSIVTPNAVMTPGGRSYDLNSWRAPPIKTDWGGIVTPPTPDVTAVTLMKMDAASLVATCASMLRGMEGSVPKGGASWATEDGMVRLADALLVELGATPPRYQQQVPVFSAEDGALQGGTLRGTQTLLSVEGANNELAASQQRDPPPPVALQVGEPFPELEPPRQRLSFAEWVFRQDAPWTKALASLDPTSLATKIQAPLGMASCLIGAGRRIQSRAVSPSPSQEHEQVEMECRPRWPLRAGDAGSSIGVPRGPKTEAAEWTLGWGTDVDGPELLVEGYAHTGNIFLHKLRGQGNTTLTVELDGVGGTMLLIKADLHRQGLVFPVAPYRRRIETEGLAMMARDMGHSVWGMPNLEIMHR
jgi:hypothetical protein